MKSTSKLRLAMSVVLAAAGLSACSMTPQNSMTFFVTSAGSGKGADFGGLNGADQH